jgi:hypothetical protein
MTIFTSHDDTIHRVPPSNNKLCLSIDMDDQSLGHLIIESYGTRLLVDDAQARKLVALLNEHLLQRSNLANMTKCP